MMEWSGSPMSPSLAVEVVSFQQVFCPFLLCQKIVINESFLNLIIKLQQCDFIANEIYGILQTF